MASSSNPFRKKAIAADGDRLPPLQTTDTSSVHASIPREPNNNGQQPIKSSMRAEYTSTTQIDDVKSKVVKKVRVLSPPPLSPDSPEWPSNVPWSASQAFSQPAGGLAGQDDPFDSASVDDSDRDSYSVEPTPPTRRASGFGQAPPNPFSKTLQDIEGQKELEQERREEGEALKAANTSGATLNVDSFRRLLMTGTANPDGPLSANRQTKEDTPVQSERNTETPNTGAQDTSEPSDDVLQTNAAVDDLAEREIDKVKDGAEAASQEKRSRQPPPPPPSSRHGKPLKDDSKPTLLGSTEATKRTSIVGVHKPLPPSPMRPNADEDSESPFDRAAAGRVPVPDHQLESKGGVDPTTATTGGKKTAPAPPPRRGHSKGEQKLEATNETKNETPGYFGVEDTAPLHPTHGDESSLRSSMDSDSAPSRAETQRHGSNAPAPPPPRRPQVAPKQNLAAASPSPSSSGFSVSSAVPSPKNEGRSQAPEPPPSRDSHSKSATKPPPPPARNPSVRRPVSVNGADALLRSTESRARDSAPPPPPPPRHRGTSPGKAEGGQDVPGKAASNEPTAEPAASADILADLEALQREVDALRGQMH